MFVNPNYNKHNIKIQTKFLINFVHFFLQFFFTILRKYDIIYVNERYIKGIKKQEDKI